MMAGTVSSCVASGGLNMVHRHKQKPGAHCELHAQVAVKITSCTTDVCQFCQYIHSCHAYVYLDPSRIAAIHTMMHNYLKMMDMMMAI